MSIHADTTLTPIPQIHVSPETAFVVNDYPYGFRLRCKIRFWIEFKSKVGFRLVSQTTNPKAHAARSGVDIWNKPKASTYTDVVLVMGLDAEGHVQSTGIGAYNLAELKAFNEKWGAFYNDTQRESATKYARIHELYEGFKAQGDPFQVAGRKAVIAYAKEQAGEVK